MNDQRHEHRDIVKSVIEHPENCRGNDISSNASRLASNNHPDTHENITNEAILVKYLVNDESGRQFLSQMFNELGFL